MEDKIVEEKEIVLINGKWKKITYESGKVNYKRYNKKHKMWVTIDFKEFEKACP